MKKFKAARAEAMMEAIQEGKLSGAHRRHIAENLQCAACWPPRLASRLLLVFSRPHQIDRARCRALLQLQSPVVARCRARSRRPSSRRAGRARGIIGCVVRS